jgi:A/G-specific adenine glycosylase
VQEKTIQVVVRRLVPWFKANARRLPWRQTTDPYAIWVSEIMLQQTQVKTVIPYYERWMRELPTIRSLAGARMERIQKLWEGLGYYRRVRHFHEAAQIVMRRHGGVFPRDIALIRELPGIGRYTAGAIHSLAFGNATPLLDGNVTRVLARLFGIDGDPRERATNETLWALADRLVQAAAAANSTWVSPFNQGLMELGALVCTTAKPRCDVCPLRGVCVARREDKVLELPRSRPRPKTLAKTHLVLVPTCRGRYLAKRRPGDGINGNYWEFPTIEGAYTRPRLNSFAAALLGPGAGEPSRLMEIRHSITRHRIRTRAFLIQARTLRVSPEAGRWVGSGELATLAFTGAHAKIVRLLQGKPGISK